MATVALLVLPSVVKERMTLHTNVDDKLIFPEIKAAQDMRIRPLLGSTLYDKILTDITNDTLSGNYLALMDNFIVDAICNYVMADLSGTINFQIWNKGVSTKTTDNSTNPQTGDLYALESKYKTRAEHYANACRLYLQENYNLFPEYYAVGGIDRVSPDNETFTSPIFLGDIRQKGISHPHLNDADYPIWM